VVIGDVEPAEDAESELERSDVVEDEVEPPVAELGVDADVDAPVVDDVPDADVEAPLPDVVPLVEDVVVAGTAACWLEELVAPIEPS
jgi:hypothetical protein